MTGLYEQAVPVCIIAPCTASQSVLFPSPHTSSQRTQQPLPWLLISRMIKQRRSGSCCVVCEWGSRHVGEGGRSYSFLVLYKYDCTQWHLRWFVCFVSFSWDMQIIDQNSSLWTPLLTSLYCTYNICLTEKFM